jgi:hypothetical protein
MAPRARLRLAEYSIEIISCQTQLERAFCLKTIRIQIIRTVFSVMIYEFPQSQARKEDPMNKAMMSQENNLLKKKPMKIRQF